MPSPRYLQCLRAGTSGWETWILGPALSLPARVTSSGFMSLGCYLRRKVGIVRVPDSQGCWGRNVRYRQSLSEHPHGYYFLSPSPAPTFPEPVPGPWWHPPQTRTTHTAPILQHSQHPLGCKLLEDGMESASSAPVMW